MSERKILFIDHYDSFSFNLLYWLKGKDCPVDIEHIYFDDPTLLEKSKKPCPLVLSPGPKSPSEAISSLSVVSRFFKRAPILGVCLGHQLLASHLGAKIVRAAQAFHGSKREIFTSEFARENIAGLGRSFRAATYNSLVAFRDEKLEKNVLAQNEWGELEGLLFPEFSTLSLQFHPESFLSENQEVFRTWWLQRVEDFYRLKFDEIRNKTPRS